MKLRYRLYGLKLSSDLSIPGLNEENNETSHPEVVVEFCAEPQWVRDALQLPSTIVQSIAASPETQDPAFLLSSLGAGQFFQLAYSDGTRFVVNGAATHIWGTAGESQTMEDLSSYFLGPVMGFILRSRGITALHASALCIEGKAILLTGEAGSGKSTTAAALALRGVAVLCEDIAPIEEKDGSFTIELGPPRICLWPEAVELLMGRADALPRLAPNWEKCHLPLNGEAATLEAEKRPLGGVYILAPREATTAAPRIEEISSREVLLDLVQNTYMNWLLDRRQRAAEFELLSHLVSQIPVRRIVPHRDPSRIDALCELILADAKVLLTSKAHMAVAAGQ